MIVSLELEFILVWEREWYNKKRVVHCLLMFKYWVVCVVVGIICNLIEQG